ncbi:hypothetical protein L195_g034645 [Trifolium pratense]|uniref:Uncharacterized protein n=1 Tax=Trifolium pratense TaxID=57577 RepID=A0A2K3LJG0_TRIPR|nr:hypothetical protein L195_g034645 [Trifolium pratense]
MEGEGDKWQQLCDEDVALNIPLIGAEHEGSNGHNNNVTTSFLKTCFNGLNALSGLRLLTLHFLTPNLSFRKHTISEVHFIQT